MSPQHIPFPRGSDARGPACHRAAAEAGGARADVEALPNRFDTTLGGWFEKGHEPNAAIDAEAEVALFERFKRLARERSALLISHRFSTVRMADRIAVLEHGRLTELGTHDTLIALGGRYARLFALQARGYR